MKKIKLTSKFLHVLNPALSYWKNTLFNSSVIWFTCFIPRRNVAGRNDKNPLHVGIEPTASRLTVSRSTNWANGDSWERNSTLDYKNYELLGYKRLWELWDLAPDNIGLVLIRASIHNKEKSCRLWFYFERRWEVSSFLVMFRGRYI